MSWKRIDADDAAKLLTNPESFAEVALFDTRDTASYESSHIYGADHLNENKLAQVIETLPKNTPVMIYCYHGNASQVYAQMFDDFRYKEVYSIDGGYEALLNAFNGADVVYMQ
jgi:rhodanese-related sulfurtransferase